MERATAILQQIIVAPAEVANKDDSLYTKVPLAPADPILKLSAGYKQDASPLKVDLGVGAYRTAALTPYVLHVVRKVEEKILSDKGNKEYLPIDGYYDFINNAAAIALGKDSPVILEKRYVATQAVGGTGSLRLGAEFIRRFFNNPIIFISKPTWGNHFKIFQDAGLRTQEYRYYNPKTFGLDIDGLLEDIKAAPEGSVFVLHACAHNPTGVDPTPEQWQQIYKAIISKRHFPFFDMAYQGFASGDLDRDAYSVRLFANNGHEVFIAQSFSKNLGFYGERVGCLTMTVNHPDIAEPVRSQMKLIVRAMYSNPPLNGARIAGVIFSTPHLFDEWLGELKVMSSRIHAMRFALFEALKANNTPGDWSHIVKQIGMFAYTGLSEQQVDVLINKYHIYLTSNGRISVCGLSEKNVDYVAKAIHFVVTGTELK